VGSTDELGVGAALAATLAGEREDDAAATKMAPGLRAAFGEALGKIADAPDRAAALRAMAKSVRPGPRRDAPLSPRARALLAARVDKATGREWLATAPAPRRGYRPPRALVDALERATHGHTYPESPDDLGRGRALLAAAIRRAKANDDEGGGAERLLDGLDAEEAAAVLALAAHEDREALCPPPALLIAATAHGGDRVRSLGALARGAGGGADGDVLGRAGRELSELGLTEEATWRG